MTQSLWWKNSAISTLCLVVFELWTWCLLPSSQLSSVITRQHLSYMNLLKVQGD